MADLTTRYLNLTLRNPIVVASSGQTKSVDKMQACADAGAGAVVIKSLFEEVLAQEDWKLESYGTSHTEVYDYMRSEITMQYGPKDYCALIENAKKKLDIPVIASINCVSAKWWPSYAKQIEAAGADALELNVFPTVTDNTMNSAQVDEIYFEIIDAVSSNTEMPVAMKISPYFSSLPYLTAELCRRGVSGLVLFNRFTQPDIDIEKLELGTTFSFSTESEINTTLKWIALLYGRTACDFAATTGIHCGKDVVKMILAGATVVQVASEIYRSGLNVINEMLNDLESWLDKKGFDSMQACRGKLAFINAGTPDHYLRSQFIEKIRGVE